jgi:hypothetical protein
MSNRTSVSSSTKRIVSGGAAGSSDTARSYVEEPAPTPRQRKGRQKVPLARIGSYEIKVSGPRIAYRFGPELETVKASCLKGDPAIKPFHTPVKPRSAVQLSSQLSEDPAAKAVACWHLYRRTTCLGPSKFKPSVRVMRPV